MKKEREKFRREVYELKPIWRCISVKLTKRKTQCFELMVIQRYISEHIFEQNMSDSITQMLRICNLGVFENISLKSKDFGDFFPRYTIGIICYQIS